MVHSWQYFFTIPRDKLFPSDLKRSLVLLVSILLICICRKGYGEELFLLNFLYFIYFGLGFLEWVAFCFDFNHLTIYYEVIDLECPDVRFWLCRYWLLRKENMQYGTKFLWKVWTIILAIKMLILVATYVFGCLKKKKQGLHLDACLSSVNWNTLKVAFETEISKALISSCKTEVRLKSTSLYPIEIQLN